jgi:hypothetical protein
MLEVEVDYVEDDYWRAIRFMRSRTWVNWLTSAFFLVVPLVVVVSRYFSNPKEWTPWLLLVPVAIFLLIFVVGRLIDRQRIRNQVTRTPSARGYHKYIFSDSGIRISSDLSDTEMKWEALVKVIESDEDIFFYQSPAFARFLPKRSLTGESQLSQLRDLMRAKLGNKVKVNK